MKKGILLAGGSGSRLYPMTEVINKHLLTIYDKPMVYYPLATLMLAGIQEILLITTPEALPQYQQLLAASKTWGINIQYAVQPKPEGIAQAFTIGESFIGKDKICLILGDNVFYGHGLSESLWHTVAKDSPGATIFAYYVNHAERYGVIDFDEQDQPRAIIEKPKVPPSNYAVTGLYFYDNDVIEIAKNLTPSNRNELEITDVNMAYLAQGKLNIEKLSRGIAWLDTGTPSSLLAASQFMETIEVRQGLKVSCPEEIAWRRGFINRTQFISLVNTLDNSSYRDYLSMLLEREHYQ